MLVDPTLVAWPVARRARPAPRGRDFGPLLAAWLGDQVGRLKPDARSALASEDAALALRLDHQALGPIEIRIAVRDRDVHAVLLARDGVACETLAGGRAVLEAALGRADLRLTGFTVEPRPQDPASSDRGGPCAASSRATATVGLDLRA
jgi:flagellar hook-length control protein FliK